MGLDQIGRVSGDDVAPRGGTRACLHSQCSCEGQQGQPSRLHLAMSQGGGHWEEAE